ncbi:MAG: copper chaperone PCu(A)C [Chloroflexi bacterium]|nr:copper chaperone PCu(A)C [Chloroflexota bacterium]
MTRLSLAVCGSLVVALLLGLAPVPPASAHSALARSVPAGQAQLALPPSSIDLWFTEPLEPAFSSFELYDSTGDRRTVSGLQVDPADDKHLIGSPGVLPPGIYTVTYRTLSTLDGHEWRGSFSFAILTEDGGVPTGSAYSPDIVPNASLTNILGRWLSFVGLAIPMGGAMVLAIVWQVGQPRDGLSPGSERLYRRLAAAALMLAAGGGLLQLQSQVDAVEASALSLLAGTRFGTYWLARMLFLLAGGVALALAAIADARRRRRVERELLAGAAFATTGAIWATTMLSHAAAAPGRFWAIVSDFVHFEVAALWIGGLVVLSALLIRARGKGRTIAPRAFLPVAVQFSGLASAGLYVLLITGIARSLGQLPAWSALWDSPYGWALLIKLMLIGAVLNVALLNRRIVLRRTGSRARETESAARLRRLLPVEAGLAVVVLASVAVLGQTPPVQRTSAEPLVLGGSYTDVKGDADLRMHFQVTPARVGQNEIRVHVYRSDGSDPGVFERVRFTVLGVDGAGGGDQVAGTAEGGGIFVVPSLLLSRAEPTDIQVDIQRQATDDVRLLYRVPVEGAPASNAGTASMFESPAPQLATGTVIWLAVAAAALGVVLRWRRNRAGWRSTAKVAGAVGVFLATFGALSATDSRPTAAEPLDFAAVERGRVMYSTNCATCHGTSGRGDGPDAAGLKPPPADFSVHVPYHDARALQSFVSNGVPGTAMPAWRDRLSDNEIRDLVHYLRSEWATASEGPATINVTGAYAHQNGDDSGAVYFELRNDGPPDRLIQVTTPAARQSRLEGQPACDNQSAAGREVKTIDVPTGTFVILKPGGCRVALSRLAGPLEFGTEIQVDLTFERAGRISVTVPVKSRVQQR